MRKRKPKNKTENKPYMKAMQMLRRSNAAGIHLTKTQKQSRNEQKRQAIKFEQENN